MELWFYICRFPAWRINSTPGRGRGRPGHNVGRVILARQIVENGLEEFLDAVKEGAARSGVKDGRVTLGRS
jgi:hypothetical protein